MYPDRGASGCRRRCARRARASGHGGGGPRRPRSWSRPSPCPCRRPRRHEACGKGRARRASQRVRTPAAAGPRCPRLAAPAADAQASAAAAPDAAAQSAGRRVAARHFESPAAGATVGDRRLGGGLAPALEPRVAPGGRGPRRPPGAIRAAGVLGGRVPLPARRRRRRARSKPRSAGGPEPRGAERRRPSVDAQVDALTDTLDDDDDDDDAAEASSPRDILARLRSEQPSASAEGSLAAPEPRADRQRNRSMRWRTS